MDKINYLRAALLLPLIVSTLAWLVTLTGYDHALLSLMLLSMLIGGAPLVLTLLILVFVSYTRPLRVFEKWWWFSPFLMALSCGIASLVFAVFNGMHDGGTRALLTSFLGLWLVSGMYSIVVGYGYVLLAAMLHALLRSAGLVLAEPIEPIAGADKGVLRPAGGGGRS